MIKTSTFLVIIFLTFFSCNNINNTEKPLLEIEHLKAENDSLKSILSELNTKYVFDNITFREIPSMKNTLTLNSDYETELVIVGYNYIKDSIMQFSETQYNNKNFNSYTLSYINGGITIKTKLDKPDNWIRFEINSENKFGQAIYSKGMDNIKIKN